MNTKGSSADTFICFPFQTVSLISKIPKQKKTPKNVSITSNNIYKQEEIKYRYNYYCEICNFLTVVITKIPKEKTVAFTCHVHNIYSYI